MKFTASAVQKLWPEQIDTQTRLKLSGYADGNNPFTLFELNTRVAIISNVIQELQYSFVAYPVTYWYWKKDWSGKF